MPSTWATQSSCTRCSPTHSWTPGLPLEAEQQLDVRVAGEWAAEWAALGGRELPVLIVADQAPVFGAEAVARLGLELVRRAWSSP